MAVAVGPTLNYLTLGNTELHRQAPPSASC